MRVLIVDDEIDICDLFADTLKEYSEDFDIDTAFSGDDALKILKEKSFDVLLTDIRMPGMSGIDLMKQAVKIQNDIQIIVVTAFADLENAIQALRSGAINYLTKPVSAEVVYYAVVNAWMKKRAIDERKQAEESLVKALDSAKAANRAKTAFLTNMSHELRTPLNGILGFIQILINTKGLSENQKKLTESIHRNGLHMLTLINDLLDIARIEADKLQLRYGEIIFPSFLKTIIDIILVGAQRKKISLNIEIDPDLPSIIIGDETRLRQVLINLLSNAIKFTEKGGVLFRVRRLNYHLNVSAQEKKATILFEIEDTGIGIPEDRINDIFLPFHQVDEYESGGHGAGLGLSISKRLVELMGGHLSVCSKLGSGSLFSFELSFPEQKVSPNGAIYISADIIHNRSEPDNSSIMDSTNNYSYSREKNSSEFIAPPLETLNNILEAVMAGKIRECHNQAETLVKSDITYKPFAEQIIEMVKRFEMGEIEGFIRKLISDMA